MKPMVKSCAGLDVHKMMVMVTIRKETDGGIDEVTQSFGTFKKDRLDLCNLLKQEHVELAIMESTGVYWKSIYLSLVTAGITTQVVNAKHVKNVPGRKTDVIDSQWLASLGHYGLVRPSFVPTPEQEQLRLLTRRRDKQKKELSNEKNRLHKTLDDAGIRLGGLISDINGKSGKMLVNGLIEGKPLCYLIKKVDPRLKADRGELMSSMDESLTPSHLYILRNIKSHIEFLEKQLAELEKLIIETIKPWSEAWELLQTIPGTSLTSAACLIGEIGDDMSNFDGMKGISSWAGLCPGNNESAGKRKSGRMRKGNKMVKTLLCEVANAAIKTESQFKGKYKGLVIRRGHKRSIIAIAHKLLRIIYTILSQRKAYYDPDINYEELMVRRNSPRWLQMMNKYKMI